MTHGPCASGDETFIRSELDYLQIRHYIDANAQKWELDCHYNGNF